jgi:zinc transporter 7
MSETGISSGSDSVANVTIAALLSTGFISVAPNLILFLFPNYAAGEGGASMLVTLGQAVAAGGLLGDVFLHTLLHASASSSLPDGERAAPDAGLFVLLGFTVFLAADMAIRTLDESRGRHEHKARDAGTRSKRDGEVDKPHHHELQRQRNRSLALLNLAADCLHNFTGACEQHGVDAARIAEIRA